MLVRRHSNAWFLALGMVGSLGGALALAGCTPSAIGSLAEAGSRPDASTTVDSPSGLTDTSQPPIDQSPGVEARAVADSGTPADQRITVGDTGTPVCPTACPTGYTCGSANGLPVCRSNATGIPLFKHIFVIPMENVSDSTLQASTNTPFIHGTLNTWARSAMYRGVAHPSLPNYLAMVSGTPGTIGTDACGNPIPVQCDCAVTGGTCTTGLLGNCTLISHGCGCPQSAPNPSNLADEIETAGLTWKSYAESYGASGCMFADATNFAVRHVPFLYYDDIRTNSTRCGLVVDYGTYFNADLLSSGGPPAFSFITPNLTDDMHDPSWPLNGPQNLANGDGWLQAQLAQLIDPTMTATNKWFFDGGLIVIVWDEDDDSGGIGGTNDPVPFYILSPYAKTKFTSTMMADHYALLALIEDGLNLGGHLGNAASHATSNPLSDFFPVN
jgi:hypothetical protein